MKEIDFNEYNFTVVKDIFSDNYTTVQTENIIFEIINNHIVINVETNTNIFNYKKVIKSIYLDNNILTIERNDSIINYNLNVLQNNYSIYQVDAKIIPSENFIEIWIPIFNNKYKKYLL